MVSSLNGGNPISVVSSWQTKTSVHRKFLKGRNELGRKNTISAARRISETIALIEVTMTD